MQEKEARIAMGLLKLQNGSKDVAEMKVVLASEQVKLQHAIADTNAMLLSLERSSAEAEKESAKVSKINAACQQEVRTRLLQTIRCRYSALKCPVPPML